MVADPFNIRDFETRPLAGAALRVWHETNCCTMIASRDAVRLIARLRNHSVLMRTSSSVGAKGASSIAEADWEVVELTKPCETLKDASWEDI